MKTILLIEDHLEMRENTAEILELAGYEVLTAADGRDGVKQALAHKPDLIICDIMMPELDGYGVLHLLSKHNETNAIPFVFLTAKAEKSDYRKGMSLGADDYLTKPFDDTELLAAVDMRLTKSERIRVKPERNVEGIESYLNEIRSLSDLVVSTENRKKKIVKKHELIYQEETYPSCVFFLSRGKVKIARNNPDGKEFITTLIAGGEFFGYTALLEEQTYSDSATALEESEVYIVPKEEFFGLLYSRKEVAQAFIRLLSNEVHDKEERLLHLAYNSVRKRVAEALLLLRERYGSQQDGFSMAVSREDLANIVGTAPETLIRTLSDFKEEKLIEVRGSTITLMDTAKLQRMKN